MAEVRLRSRGELRVKSSSGSTGLCGAGLEMILRPGPFELIQNCWPNTSWYQAQDGSKDSLKVLGFMVGDEACPLKWGDTDTHKKHMAYSKYRKGLLSQSAGSLRHASRHRERDSQRGRERERYSNTNSTHIYIHACIYIERDLHMYTYTYICMYINVCVYICAYAAYVCSSKGRRTRAAGALYWVHPP